MDIKKTYSLSGEFRNLKLTKGELAYDSPIGKIQICSNLPSEDITKIRYITLTSGSITINDSTLDESLYPLQYLFLSLYPIDSNNKILTRTNAVKFRDFANMTWPGLKKDNLGIPLKVDGPTDWPPESRAAEEIDKTTIINHAVFLSSYYTYDFTISGSLSITFIVTYWSPVGDSTIKYFNGSKWEEATVNYFDGKSFIETIPYYYDGKSFIELSH